jgi:hypothetical protein
MRSRTELMLGPAPLPLLCTVRSGRTDVVGSGYALVGRFRESLSLILNLAGYLRERFGVLATVMRAEHQLERVREHDTDVRLGAAAVAHVRSRERLGGG